jgi:hypothetical protein
MSAAGFSATPGIFPTDGRAFTWRPGGHSQRRFAGGEIGASVDFVTFATIRVYPAR